MPEASRNDSAQAENHSDRFQRMYITSGEICREMSVSRPSVLNARKRGILPNAIEVSDGLVFIWEREPLQPYLAAWKIALASRRSELV